MNNVTELTPAQELLKVAAEDDVFVIVKKCGNEYRTITLDPDEQRQVLAALIENSQPWGSAS